MTNKPLLLITLLPLLCVTGRAEKQLSITSDPSAAPGYKVWERRIIVEAESSKTLNAILEKEVIPKTAQ